MSVIQKKLRRWHEPVAAKATEPDRSAAGLRIALFSGNYNCVRDGANKALNRLAAFLIERGAAVRVYSPVSEHPAFEPAGDLVAVPSIAIPGRPEYRFSVGLPRAIRADIERFRPTHVHLSCPDILGGRALVLARSLGVPVVTSVHTRFETYPSYYGLGFLTPLIRARLRSVYSRSDYVLAPNLPMAEGVLEFGVSPERVRVWGRGVDRAVFSPSRRDDAWRRSIGYRGDEPIILFFGRLVHEKGLAAFEEVIRRLEARGLEARPLVVGDGPARGWLEQRLPTAWFAGHLEGEALGRAVASADILVNPSLTEAFGNVNLEAMASGLAIVSADVGSARALIDPDRTGVLVPPRDIAAYADAVEALIRNAGRRRRLSLAAAAAASAHEWPAVLQAVLDVYRSSAA